MDIHAHDGNPAQALREARNWLANVSRRMLPSATRLTALYAAFTTDLPGLAGALEFHPDQIPYADFERIVVGWLLDAQPAAG